MDYTSCMPIFEVIAGCFVNVNVTAKGAPTVVAYLPDLAPELVTYAATSVILTLSAYVLPPVQDAPSPASRDTIWVVQQCEGCAAKIPVARLPPEPGEAQISVRFDAIKPEITSRARLTTGSPAGEIIAEKP